MIRVWAQFGGVFLIAFLAIGAYTGAYFSDIEQSGNTIAASLLDGELTGDPFNDRVCAVNETEMIELMFRNNSTMPFEYDVLLDNFAGGACDNLKLEVLVNNVQVFQGFLMSFAESGLSLDASVTDTWQFNVMFPDGMVPNDPTCTFDSIFSAYQLGLMSGQAFYDVETLGHSIAVQTNGTGSTTVTNTNHATVTNNVNVSANTGGNSSNGGTITTGNATSSVTIVNVVNTNETTIIGCGCEDDDDEYHNNDNAHDKKPDRRRGRTYAHGNIETIFGTDPIEFPEPEIDTNEATTTVESDTSGNVVEIYISTEIATSTQ